jgi:hypothetical protein
MTIYLDPPKRDSPSFEIDHQIVIALGALYKHLIKIRGAGRFGELSATILLQSDGDADLAMAALKSVGIHGTVSTDAAEHSYQPHTHW